VREDVTRTIISRLQAELGPEPPLQDAATYAPGNPHLEMTRISNLAEAAARTHRLAAATLRQIGEECVRRADEVRLLLQQQAEVLDRQADTAETEIADAEDLTARAAEILRGRPNQ